MTSESVHARHLVELGFLQDAVRELGMRSTLIERSNDVAYHTLLVSLAADAKGRERQLALNYYPLEDEEFEDTLFLQYFIGLSTEVKQATLPAIREFLPAINNKVVIGHFGITEGTTLCPGAPVGRSYRQGQSGQRPHPRLLHPGPLR